MEEKFMREALKLAKRSASNNEVPVGCVITHKDKIIGTGSNRREATFRISGHAEIVALEKAGKELGTWKLEECDMYVTLEPCVMCYGAIMQSRLKNVYIALKGNDNKEYSFSKSLQIPKNFYYGVLEEESMVILKAFFKKMRKRKERNA